MRYLGSALTAVIGVAASIAMFLAVAHWDQRLAQMHLAEAAGKHLLTINTDLAGAGDVMDTLRARFDSVEHPVTRREYQAFAKSMRQRLDGLRDTAWAPRVRRDERDAFEQAARADGFPDFQIWERDAEGRRVRAGERDEYFPVFYADPAKDNDPVMGFDLASERIRGDTMLRAYLTGRAASTPPIQLLTGEQPLGGFVAFVPVSVADNLKGFVLGAFETGRMIEYILAAKTQPAGLDIYVFDRDAAPGHRFIYWHSSRTRLAGAPVPSEADLRAGPNH
jgi:diguanylate cyclase